MRLAFQRILPASPDAVWPFLTEPARMNAWSLARVDSLSLGDGGDAGGVGALRRVTIRAPGGRVALTEVIEHSEPPSRLVYRVVRGAPLRDHRGEITLRAEGAQTLLQWEVDLDFLVPGLAVGARFMLEKQLEESLDALSMAVRGAPPGRLFPGPFADDLAEVATLEGEVSRVLAEQTDLADQLGREGDRKFWFTRVYQYVTEAQREHCRAGRATHRAWVMRLIPRFHEYYVGNLRAYLGEGQRGAESHWQVAFAAMDRARSGSETVRGLLFGVAAHIEDDLPRALAEVYRCHYAGKCDFVRFRADYLLMANIFRHASERLVAEMPSDFLPLYLRVLDPVLPIEVKDRILNRYYDVPRKREQAFERGARLALWSG